MLFKIWMNNHELGFDFSIIVDVDNVDTAIAQAIEISKIYKAKLKAVDNIHSESATKHAKDYRQSRGYSPPHS